MKFNLLSASAMGLVAAVGWASGANAQAMDECRDGVGETLVGLDEKTYTFSEGQVVISDDENIESIAGIMGGLATGCTEETTDVFLEAAVWDHIQIAMTGRALKINSDARYRNERGIDPEFNMEAVELATQMILDLCGGEPSNVVVAGAVPDTARALRVDPLDPYENLDGGVAVLPLTFGPKALIHTGARASIANHAHFPLAS